jgi:hypothetical protein
MWNPCNCIKYNIVARSIRRCWDIDKSIYEVRKIAEKMHKALTDEKLIDSLVKKGLERLISFQCKRQLIGF